MGDGTAVGGKVGDGMTVGLGSGVGGTGVAVAFGTVVSLGATVGELADGRTVAVDVDGEGAVGDGRADVWEGLARASAGVDVGGVATARVDGGAAVLAGVDVTAATIASVDVGAAAIVATLATTAVAEVTGRGVVGGSAGVAAPAQLTRNAARSAGPKTPRPNRYRPIHSPRGEL